MEQSKKKVWGEKWSCNYIKTTTTQKKIHDFSFQLPALDFEFQIYFTTIHVHTHVCHFWFDHETSIIIR